MTSVKPPASKIVKKIERELLSHSYKADNHEGDEIVIKTSRVMEILVESKALADQQEEFREKILSLSIFKNKYSNKTFQRGINAVWWAIKDKDKPSEGAKDMNVARKPKLKELDK